ncbi:hypothetical protein [Aestuariibaculum sediminum]|uniref:Uncharacterized protein n=1 Tax=Aestuariibaculum sediminum TaxID=2770637 RepID=A0A8J6Q2J1_9FLAO|nr:hypothetical protein [Aestuariibaculum sediminum]MBD0833662.1 hypothetical protein [Aestuariibaculum sediminum]
MKKIAIFILIICSVMFIGCSKETIETEPKEEIITDSVDDSEALQENNSVYSIAGAALDVRVSYQDKVDDFFIGSRRATYLQPTGITFNKSATLENNLVGINGFNVIYDYSGFSWDAIDQNTETWYPQGITGFRWGNRRFIAVSWYSKSAHGSRLSLCDITDMNNVVYRNILLVRKSGGNFAGTSENFNNTSYTQYNGYAPNFVHAGGLAYYNRKLYVTGSSTIDEFDLDKIIEVTASGGGGKIGYSSADGKMYAFGYQYILPRIASYTVDSSHKPLSAMSLSYNTNGDPRINIGNYYNLSSTSGHAYVHSFALNSDGTINTSANVRKIDPIDTDGGYVNHMQGLFAKDGIFYFAVSGKSEYYDSTSRLLLWEYGTQNTKRYRFPHGTEGLYYSPYYHDLWGLMEHPGQRAVFGLPLSTYSF